MSLSLSKNSVPTSPVVVVEWLYRAEAAKSEKWVAEAVAATDFPQGTFDIFVHGEAEEVGAVWRHLPSTAAST